MEISSHFLNELFRLLFLKKDILDICSVYLEYHYIPKELQQYKKILKDCLTYYNNTQKIPSFGIIAQQNINDKKLQEILDVIKKTKIQEKEVIIKQLEQYIKEVKFVELHENLTKLYNDDKQEEAIRLQAIESEKIVNFSLSKDTGRFKKVFSDFNKRNDKRRLSRLNDEHKIVKIPFGIDELDEITYGGIEKGQSDLMITRSGAGKTTYLIWRAISAARRGFKVLYISAEDTEERILAKIDSAWTAISFKDIRWGEIDVDLQSKLDKVVNDLINKGAEIDVIAFEQFDQASMKDVRNIILDYIKINGQEPDLICLDYLEEFQPGDGKRYSASTDGEKLRRQAIAKKITNIATEFKIGMTTAMQTGDIAPDHYNRPEFVITRHNASGDRNIVNSFSYVFTWNMTDDEKKNKVGRIYVDKLRDFESGQKVKIATAFNKGKFFDRVRSIQLYGVEE